MAASAARHCTASAPWPGAGSITAKGKWPFAPMVPLDEYPEPGDWCVATGHPGGGRLGSKPPVRLGRVIDVSKYVLRTDCTINSGDSDRSTSPPGTIP